MIIDNKNWIDRLKQKIAPEPENDPTQVQP
jgi:hypothetical protein